MDFDDRFKILLDLESAPNGISTSLPTHLTSFGTTRFFADFNKDQKPGSRSHCRLPFIHVKCMHEPILGLVCNPNAFTT